MSCFSFLIYFILFWRTSRRLGCKQHAHLLHAFPYRARKYLRHGWRTLTLCPSPGNKIDKSQVPIVYYCYEINWNCYGVSSVHERKKSNSNVEQAKTRNTVLSCCRHPLQAVSHVTIQHNVEVRFVCYLNFVVDSNSYKYTVVRASVVTLSRHNVAHNTQCPSCYGNAMEGCLAEVTRGSSLYLSNAL